MIWRVLFPFKSTYNKLQLQTRWWHRLAVSLFAITVVLLTLGVSGSRIGNHADEREHRLNALTESFMTKTVLLDDSESSTKLTRDLSARYEILSDTVRREYDRKLWGDIGFSLGFAFSLSYVLQLIYRLAIYVAFGPPSYA